MSATKGSENMKNKKILLLFSIIMVFFCTLNNVKAVGNSDYDTDSNGDGLDTSGSTASCSISQGCVHNEIGVRVTLVDDSGKQISGTHYMDFWNIIPLNARGKTGSTFRSQYINKYGSGLQSESFTAVGEYASGNVTSDLTAIGGSISFKNQHELIEDEIKKDMEKGKKGKKCIVPKLFELLGYSNFCDDVINDNECEEKMSKTYVLVEPMYYVNYKKKNVALTGTELAALIYYTRIVNGDNVSTKNLNRSAFDNAITNMYLTAKDSQYDFKANGKVYNNFDAYANGLLDINIIDYWNLGKENQDVIKAAIGKDESSLYPLGNSMHLVWLGTISKDYCGEEECCIPCDPESDDFETCKQENHPNDTDYYCCYADEIATGFDEDGNPICEDADKFWEDKQDIFEEICLNKCVPPSDNPAYCCYDCPPGGEIFVNGIRMSCNKYIEEYCEEVNDCPIPDTKPEVIIDECDKNNDENISYFRDGVFNSENGQFKDWNKIEDIETYIKNHDGNLPTEWIDRVVKDYEDNTFLSVAYSEDTRYTTFVDNYCNMHCQEVFEVTLPDNYPLVNAGRYFKWTIKDSTNDISKATGAKLCSVDINLDKAIDDYIMYNEEAQKAAEALANTSCAGGYGIAPVINADFKSKEEYLQTYQNHCLKKTYCREAHIETHDHYYPCTGSDGKPTTCSKPFTDLVVCDTYWSDFDMTWEDTMRDYWVEGCGGYKTSVPTEEYRINRKLEKYTKYVEKFAANVNGIINSIELCNSVGSELEMNMEIELNYQTLFEPIKTYSTPDSIDKIKVSGVTGSVFDCIDNNETYECNQDKHIFALSDRTHEGENIYAIRCDNNSTWYEKEMYPDTSNKGLSGGGMISIVYQPIEVYNNLYNSSLVTMLNGITGYDRISGSYNSGSLYKYELNWNTIFMGFISNSDLYKLDEKINACVCKDGEIKDLEDGVCSCTRTVDYDKFLEDYNNYQVLPDGTLTVEFMNGSGLYPISLKYWTIGSVDENGDGHFDSWLKDGTLQGCDSGICLYGNPEDSEDICRFVIKNRIIANPDDNCVGDDCEPDNCPEGNCTDPDPDPDLGDCIVDGKPVYECGNVAGLSVIYRVVDLDNPFPGIDGTGRTLPSYSNWYNKDYIITNNRGVNGNALYTSNITPLYSATLNPAVIKAIRADNEKVYYNDKKVRYLDYLAGTVIYPDKSPGVKGGGYSLFVHNFRFNNNLVIDSQIENIQNSTPDVDWNKQFENIINTASTVGGGGI